MLQKSVVDHLLAILTWLRCVQMEGVPTHLRSGRGWVSEIVDKRCLSIREWTETNTATNSGVALPAIYAPIAVDVMRLHSIDGPGHSNLCHQGVCN